MEGSKTSTCINCGRPIYNGTYRASGRMEPDYDPGDDPSTWRHENGYAVCPGTWAQPSEPLPSNSTVQRTLAKVRKRLKATGNKDGDELAYDITMDLWLAGLIADPWPDPLPVEEPTVALLNRLLKPQYVFSMSYGRAQYQGGQTAGQVEGARKRYKSALAQIDTLVREYVGLGPSEPQQPTDADQLQKLVQAGHACACGSNAEHGPHED